VGVLLQFNEHGVCLEVADDGRGFDPALAKESGGMGLPGMEERVHRINGRLEVSSAPGEGTTLRVAVEV
jgi:signal transduction histidine kinase